MFQIVHIYLKNFRGSKEIKLSFPNDKVTIIHGINGSGKTTLLKIIHAMFKMNEVILMDEKIIEGTIVLSEKEKDEKKHITVKLDAEGTYEWTTDIENYEDFLENFSSLIFGVNRGNTSNNKINNVAPSDVHRMLREFNLEIKSRVRTRERESNYFISSRIIEDITDYLNNQISMRTKRMRRNRNNFDFNDNHLMLDGLSMNDVGDLLHRKYIIQKKYMAERVQSALFETLAQVVDSKSKDYNDVPEDLTKKLSEYRDTLIELLSDLKDNELSKAIVHALSYHENKERINPFVENGLISNLVYNMITELEKGKGIFNTVNQLVDEFNDYLGNSKKLIIDENGARIQTTTGHSHEIDKLSSGERHLLSFLTLFVIEGSRRDILMIDEPEISLNLEWQSKLLYVLSRFAPDSQIIVATHSPAIAEYNTNCLVEIK